MGNAKQSLGKIREIDGFIGACLVDSDSGMMLSSAGGESFDLEIASAGNTEVVRAKRRTLKGLNINDQIEDILITLHKQYHLIRPVRANESLFLYLVIDRAKSNLAMARHQLAVVEKDLKI